MVLSDTISYVTLLGMTIVFTSFALVIKEEFWRVTLKIVASVFWFVMAVAQFIFFGSESAMMVMSLPYAIIGMIMVWAILHDFLGDKKERIWKFNED